MGKEQLDGGHCDDCEQGNGSMKMTDREHSEERGEELQQPCPSQSQPARQASPRHRLPLLVSFTSLSSLAHHFAGPPGASPGIQLPSCTATLQHRMFVPVVVLSKNCQVKSQGLMSSELPAIRMALVTLT